MSAYRSSQPSLRSFAPPVELVRPRHDSKERPRTRPQPILPLDLHDGDREIEAALDPVRRVVNVVLATLALVVALPVMLLVALAVKLTSRGPVFYTQVRVGLDRRQTRLHANNHRRESDLGGRPFRILKFRTMYVDAEERTGAIWATPDDPRVTPVGRLLRASRLDELPQLLNVIRGEMNIVGPRPERPTIFAELRENITEYPLRQRAKPGITGLAQINQHYDSCLDDVRRKVQYDLEYIERQSVLEDLRIMLKTIPVVLFRKGGW
ncbi:MAG TPA: sugar transferase [Gemmatimonadales bacterium]|nr:sugar transferase [Gemmatimonadales bacterium]